MKIEGVIDVNLEPYNNALMIVAQVKDVDCKKIIDKFIETINEIIISAERDLTELEEVMIESARRYAEKEKLKKKSE